jgi:flagellar capping protein FliD
MQTHPINSIEWHKQCLENIRSYRNKKYDDFLHLMKEIKRLDTELELYQNQIKTAEQRDKTKFDRDKFLIKRENKINTIMAPKSY